MINDRGAKKWLSSFMLPEHVKMLSDLWKEQKLVEKPIIDEQEFEEIGIIIRDSLDYTLDIKLTYWKSGRFEVVTGIVGRVDMQLKQVRMDLEDDDIVFIMLDSITAAERI